MSINDEIFTDIILVLFEELEFYFYPGYYSQEVLFRVIFKNCELDRTKGCISKYLKCGFSKKFVKCFCDTKVRSTLISNIRVLLHGVDSIYTISQIYQKQEDILINKYKIDNIKPLRVSGNDETDIKIYIEHILCAIELACHTSDTKSTQKAICPLKCFQPKKYDWFVGRKDELETMHSLIAMNGYVILYGFHGLGKTELAKRYMAEYSDEYDILLKTNYCGNLKDTISSLEFKGELNITYASSKNKAKKTIRQTINDPNYKVLLLIDNFTFYNNAKLFYDDMKDYRCDFIFTTNNYSLSLSSASSLKVEKLSSGELHELLIKSSDDSINEAFFDDILKHTYNHTLLISLISKQLKGKPEHVQHTVDKLKSNDYPDGNIHSGHSGSKKYTTIKSHIDEMLDISALPSTQQHILTLFTLLPENHALDRCLAAQLSNSTSVIDELVFLGWLSCSDMNSCDRKYNMHPLLYHSITRNIKYYPRRFSYLLLRIAEFTTGAVTSCYNHNISQALFSICKTIHKHIKTNYTTEFKLAINGTIRWLAINGEKQMAYDLFSITNKKNIFTPTTYLSLCNIDDESIINGLLNQPDNRF